MSQLVADPEIFSRLGVAAVVGREKVNLFPLCSSSRRMHPNEPLIILPFETSRSFARSLSPFEASVGR